MKIQLSRYFTCLPCITLHYCGFSRKHFRHEIHKNINLQNLINDEDKIRGSQVPHTKDRISSFFEHQTRKNGLF